MLFLSLADEKMCLEEEGEEEEDAAAVATRLIEVASNWLGRVEAALGARSSLGATARTDAAEVVQQFIIGVDGI